LYVQLSLPMNNTETNTVAQKRILHLTTDYSKLLHLPYNTMIGFKTCLYTGALVKFLTEFNAPDSNIVLPVRIVQIEHLGGGNWEVLEFDDGYLPF
jgi:hypothetical protein